VDSPLDPETFRDDDAVDFRSEQSRCDIEDFAYFASIAGMVAVGVVNDAGRVLLMDGPHGWRLPYTPVDPEADWVETAEAFAGELTGRPVEMDDVERVAAVTNSLTMGPEKTDTFEVVLRSVPIDGDPVVEACCAGPWEDLDLGWFDVVPDDAYWDHDAAVDDILRVLD
jgi:hypothetical protein